MSQLSMLRPSLEGLPMPPLLPDGYQLRTFLDGDESSAAETLMASFEDANLNADWVLKELGHHPDIWAMFVVLHGGKVVATASSKRLPDLPSRGYVHYVGTHPDHGGKALGLAVTLATLHEFVRHGCTEAILDTDDFRIPAIKTYLRLGFEPLLNDETHAERWAKVRENLGNWKP